MCTESAQHTFVVKRVLTLSSYAADSVHLLLGHSIAIFADWYSGADKLREALRIPHASFEKPPDMKKARTELDLRVS